MQKDLNSFVEGLQANSNNEETIYIEMAQNRYRWQRKFAGVKKEIEESTNYAQVVADKFDEYKKYIIEDQKGSLAEYVARRKSVLDLFDKLLGFDSENGNKDHLEKAVHELICPMRVDSHQVTIEDHNLWILDDRLAFFNFFASDRPISQFTDVKSDREPDIAFFYDRCLAWRESDRLCDTVILVEFKRPNLPTYSDKNDPYMQLMDYVARFQSGETIRDRNGATIMGIGKHTSFQCYIVADLTEGLKKRLRGRFQTTPDGNGLFGYTVAPDAYVEVIPYKKLLIDAQMRNSVFFQKLGLEN